MLQMFQHMEGCFWLFSDPVNCIVSIPTILTSLQSLPPSPSPWEHTHTHPFNGPFSRTTQVSRYQKGKTNLDFTEARDSEWQWHQLGHMQVCTQLQADNHANTPPLSFFTGRMPFLQPNQQRQSTEGIWKLNTSVLIVLINVNRIWITRCRTTTSNLHTTRI